MDFNEIKKCNDEHKIYIGTDWGLDNHSIDALRYCYDDLIMTKDAHNMYCLGLWEKEKKKKKENEKPKIEKVIFNEPATIVLWSDGTKTVVKCQEEEFDKEKGLAMAIAKRFLRTNTTGSNYYDEFKKWIPKEESISNEIAITLNAVDINDSWKQLGSTAKVDGKTQIYFKGLI